MILWKGKKQGGIKMNEPAILVVDDDKEIADLVEIHLISDGFKVSKAYNARDGYEILKKDDLQFIILDIMMPEIDALTLCQMIRKTSTVPIIMLSAKSADLDKIVGLSTGADDYVVKPFNPLELIARVKSQLRRYTEFNKGTKEEEEKEKDSTIYLENLTINKENHKVIAYGKEVSITPIEFNILYLLASNKGKVFSTDEIFAEVWKEKMYEANNTVMVHIRRLREKIEADPKNAKIIKTVWGVGYKIEK